MKYHADKERTNLVVQILARIHTAKAKPIIEEELARELGYSARHIARTFVEAMGEGIAEYAQRIRLEYAAGQLSLSNAPIKAVAVEAHYTARRAFTRAFFNHFGMTPTDFRQWNAGQLHVLPGHYAITDAPAATWPREVGIRSRSGITTLHYCGTSPLHG